MAEPTESVAPDAAEQPDATVQPDNAEQPDAAEQPGTEQPDTEQSERSNRATGRPVRLVLAAVAVLLLAFGATMTVLYVREASARDRAAATATSRAAQLDELRKQLAELQAQRTDLQAQLKAAQDKVIDPAAYEKIKNCVQAYAQAEKFVGRAIAGNPDPQTPAYVFLGPDNSHMKGICEDAAKYLK